MLETIANIQTNLSLTENYEIIILIYLVQCEHFRLRVQKAKLLQAVDAFSDGQSRN